MPVKYCKRCGHEIRIFRHGFLKLKKSILHKRGGNFYTYCHFITSGIPNARWHQSIFYSKSPRALE